MKLVLFGLAVVGLVTLPVACNPFAPDQSLVLDVSKLEAPASVSVGSPLTVSLTVVTGGCVSFDRIVAERSAFGASLTVLGRDAAKGRRDVACTADIRFELHSYELDPPPRGTFSVEANRPRLDPLTTTVQVQ
jgi:hypothetical protein